MEKEPIGVSVEKSDQEIFREKFENASPSAIEKIKETMKRPETWLGTLMLIGGGYMSYKIYGTDQVAKDTAENLNANMEAVKEVLLALKVVTGTVITSGALATFLGIQKGVHNAKVDKALEEEN